MQRTHKRHNGETLTATAHLTKFAGQDAYFSLTGELYERRRMVACGCMHDDLMKVWPDLEPLVVLHLSAANGMPTHAMENGWYWLGKTKWQSFDRDAVARHFRILPCQADILRITIETKAQMQDWVNEQKPRWKAEADNAIATFDLQEVAA